jgi:hypothetical protein
MLQSAPYLRTRPHVMTSTTLKLADRPLHLCSFFHLDGLTSWQLRSHWLHLRAKGPISRYIVVHSYGDKGKHLPHTTRLRIFLKTAKCFACLAPALVLLAVKLDLCISTSGANRPSRLRNHDLNRNNRNEKCLIHPLTIASLYRSAD